MHDHQTWYGVFHNCPIYLCQQTSITIQYKINLKYMFKDILYPTLRSVQINLFTGVLCTSPVLLFAFVTAC